MSTGMRTQRLKFQFGGYDPGPPGVALSTPARQEQIPKGVRVGVLCQVPTQQIFTGASPHSCFMPGRCQHRGQAAQSGSLSEATSQDLQQELLFPENAVFPEAFPPEPRPPHPPCTVTHYCRFSLRLQTCNLAAEEPHPLPPPRLDLGLAVTSSPKKS